MRCSADFFRKPSEKGAFRSFEVRITAGNKRKKSADMPIICLYTCVYVYIIIYIYILGPTPPL